jgi:hypothetical protein
VRVVERCSEAVARGNAKVFDEIGLAFARFVAALEAGPAAGDAVERVAAGLRPGPPPDGQDLLRAAFAGYALAARATAPGPRAEQLLLANLRIGLHEQTRLQPEIAEALDAPLAGVRDLRVGLVRALVPQGRALPALRRLPAVARMLDQAVERLGDRLRLRLRGVITECFMTLDLPGGPVRLGRDLVGTCPEVLRAPAEPGLVELLARVDPVAGGTVGSGAEDWADLAQRMHFITELFRARHADASLFDPPFDAEQTAAIRQARMPTGRI